MLVDMNHATKLQDRFRGMMIGLALGDATVAEDGSIQAGVATELACYQLNSMLRQWLPGDPEDLLKETRSDLCRWLWMRDSGEPADSDFPWFTSHTPFQLQDRGNPTGTLKALKNGAHIGSGRAHGIQGLVRVAPMSILGVQPTTLDAHSMAHASCSLTHAGRVCDMAPAFIQLLANLMTSIVDDPHERLLQAWGTSPYCPIDTEVVFNAPNAEPDLRTLQRLAPAGRASQVMLGGMYAASCSPGELGGALQVARHAADPDGVCAIAGAIVGASTGVVGTMEKHFARHEFAYVIERLVSDAFAVSLTAGEPVEALQLRYPATTSPAR